jgi:hypothetical protein
VERVDEAHQGFHHFVEQGGQPMQHLDQGTQGYAELLRHRGASIKDIVDSKGIRFNSSAFSVPPDQRPGNAPAVSSIVR